MILEAFQGAITRNADGLLHFAVGYFVMMTGLAVVAVIHIVRPRGGHQPSSSGERPEPPRSGSGVRPPVDQSARIARLRAELDHLAHIASGGTAIYDTPKMMLVAADEMALHCHGDEIPDIVKALRHRSQMLQQALASARDTLEATKPEPPADWGGRRR